MKLIQVLFFWIPLKWYKESVKYHKLNSTYYKSKENKLKKSELIKEILPYYETDLIKNKTLMLTSHNRTKEIQKLKNTLEKTNNDVLLQYLQHYKEKYPAKQSKGFLGLRPWSR